MCTSTIVAVPSLIYVAATMSMAGRAWQGRVARPPGLFWQFERQAYNDVGWRWHRRSLWMFVGFVPFVLLCMLIAKLLCPD
jgi:hypothetical protein